MTAPAGPNLALAKGTGRTASRIGVATAASRLIGFGRVLVVAAVLGTTDLGDVFLAANSVSNVLFDLLAAGALSAVLVPAFVAVLAGPDAVERTERLAGALLGWSLAVLVPVTVVGVAAAPALARLLVAGEPDPVVEAAQVDLATFLLRLFVPQVLLYAYGAVVTAVLHAHRNFTVTVVAPIGNTVVMVVALAAFRWLHGPVSDATGPGGFGLNGAERLALAAAGTLGVAAFVGIPAVALWRRGVRVRPRLRREAPGFAGAVRLSGWAGLAHAGTGVLLGAAVLVGAGVTGGVVAYQVAYYCFLVPHAVLALPYITAVLPDLAGHAARGDRDAVAGAIRFCLERMAALLIPVSAAAIVFAPEVMEALAVGRTSGSGGRLIGVALAALGAGLFPFAALLLLVRAGYALGDGRGPAAAALGSALFGAALMTLTGLGAEGEARLLAIGAAHTLAQALGALTLGRHLGRRVGTSLLPPGLGPVFGWSILLGGACAGGLAAVDPQGTPATLATCAGLAAVGGLAYAALARPFWSPWPR